MNPRRPKSQVLVPVRLLAAIALATDRLHAAVEIYVTDYLAAQDKSVKPLGGIRTNVARLFATPGEYEPVGFAVRPDERIEQLFLAATDLSGPGGIIPKSQVRWPDALPTRPPCPGRRDHGTAEGRLDALSRPHTARMS